MPFLRASVPSAWCAKGGMDPEVGHEVYDRSAGSLLRSGLQTQGLNVWLVHSFVQRTCCTADGIRLSLDITRALTEFKNKPATGAMLVLIFAAVQI